MKKSEKNALRRYKRLLSKLKTLIKNKRDESDEGELLRQKMDDLWRKLPEKERKKLNKKVVLPTIRVD